MSTPNTKPVVCITHVLVSSEEGVQYFAIPEEYKTFPKNAVLVALGGKEKCWIEVFPVGADDTEGVDDFSEDLEVTVNIDDSFFMPGTPYLEIVNWRWFTCLTDN